jgi:hypothetical protein
MLLHICNKFILVVCQLANDASKLSNDLHCIFLQAIKDALYPHLTRTGAPAPRVSV